MNTSPRPPNYDTLSDLLLEELKDVGVFIMDLERRITSWSPGVERILGYTESDFIGRDGNALFTPEDREQKLDDKEFDRARTDGRAPDMRWHMKKDGSRVFVNGVLRALADEEGTHVGYTKIIRDISPDRVSDCLLHAILDRTPDAITAKDRDGRYTFANSETARMLGLSINEVVGRPFEEFFPAHISAPLRENDTSVMNEKNLAS
jgi:PAS domain S-box-containing protein